MQILICVCSALFLCRLTGRADADAAFFLTDSKGFDKLMPEVRIMKEHRRETAAAERSFAISRAIFWSALFLLGLSLYEFCTRIDAMSGPLRMFFNMAVGERIPLSRVANYIDWSIFTQPLWLLGCMIAAVWGLIGRRSHKSCTVLFFPALALCVLGFLLRPTLFGEWIRTLKLLPLLLMTLMCLLRAVYRKRRPHPRPEEQPNVIQIPVAPHMVPRKRRGRRAS